MSKCCVYRRCDITRETNPSRFVRLPFSSRPPPPQKSPRGLHNSLNRNTYARYFIVFETGLATTPFLHIVVLRDRLAPEDYGH